MIPLASDRLTTFNVDFVADGVMRITLDDAPEPGMTMCLQGPTHNFLLLAKVIYSTAMVGFTAGSA